MPVFNFNFPLTIRDNRWLLGAIVVVVATRSWTIYLNKWITIRLTAWSCKTNKSVAKPTRMWRQKFGGECDASFDNAFHKACSSQENRSPAGKDEGAVGQWLNSRMGTVLTPPPPRTTTRTWRCRGRRWWGGRHVQARRVDSLVQWDLPSADGLRPQPRHHHLQRRQRRPRDSGPSSASWSPQAYYSLLWMVCYRFPSIMCFYVYWTPRIK